MTEINGPFLRAACLQTAAQVHCGNPASPPNPVLVAKTAKDFEAFCWAGLEPLPVGDNSPNARWADFEASLREAVSSQPVENAMMEEVEKFKSLLLACNLIGAKDAQG